MKKIILFYLINTFVFAQLFINEIDYDQPGTDAGEFIEISGPSGVYSNVLIRLMNGNNNSEYGSYQISTLELDDENSGYGFFVIGSSVVSNVDYSSGFPSSNAIQNGEPDGIELWLSGELIDAVSYEGPMDDSNGNLMEEATPNDDEDQYWEGGEGLSIGRIGLDGSPWGVSNSSPGSINPGQILDENADFPPVANAGNDMVANSGDVVTLDGSNSSDSDGEIVDYLWEQTAGSNLTLSSYSEPIVTFDVPEVTETTTWTFELTVEDDGGNSSSDEVNITVYQLTQISIYEIQENVSTYEGQLVNVVGVVTIGDGLLFPGRAKFYIQDDSGRGIQVYNASELEVTYNRGDYLEVVGTIDIYNDDVEIINPEITLLDTGYPLPEAHIVVGDESLTMNGTWAKSSGQLSDYWYYISGSTEFTALTITLENGNDIQTMFWNSAVPSSDLTQYEDMVGEELSISGVITFYNGAVQSTCGYLSDIEDNTDPTLPVAQAGSDQVVFPGDLVTLDGSASSDDVGVIAYEWVQIDGTPVILDDEESVVTSFTAPEQNDVIVFRLTIWDNDFNESSDEVTITITGPITIYEIQYTDEQGQYCYESNLTGEIVTTTGIVTAVVPGSPNFFIQDFNFDTYSGIYIYDNSYNPEVGQEVTVSGTVNEFYSFTQLIDLTSFTVNSSNNNLVIKDITTGELANGCTESGESLEGMLVRVSNVSVTQESSEYGEWYVDDGTGPCQIDDGSTSSPMFDGDWPEPGINDSFMNIAGVVDYNYNEFAILPRNSNDFNNELSINQTVSTPFNSNLSQNYPNPFNPETIINFNVEKFEKIKISIFDLNGIRVNTLLDKYLNEGNYSIEWNGTDINGKSLPSGTYIYQYQSSENILSKKMILLK